MKKFFCSLLFVVYFFNVCCFPVFCSTTETQDTLIEKYDFTETQKIFIKSITRSNQNLDNVKYIVENGLLEDCQNSLKNRFGSPFYASQLYLIAKANPKHLSKKELKKIDKDFGNDYFIKIDDNFYNGVSKIDFKEVRPNSNIKVYDKFYYKNIKTLKKYLAIQEKYSFDDKVMDYIMTDTNKLTKEKKTLQKALDDGLYEKYTTYCHGKSVALYPSGFPKRYNAVKKIESSKFLTEKQKQEAYRYRNYIIKTNDVYYKNLYKIKDFSEVKNPEYFSTSKFPYIKNLKEYNKFQKEFQLDEATMSSVWNDSKRLKKNKKLIKQALEDGTYQEFNRIKKGGFSRKRFSPFTYCNTETRFKENYEAFIYLKEHSNFKEKQIQRIILKDGEPDVAINPYYWGNKVKKIKKTMKKKKLSDNQKYEQIMDRMYYRRPTTDEWISDAATKALIAGLFLSGIGIIGGIMALAGFSDAGGTFIKIVW